MALNFPDSPTAGTVFGAWRFDGTKWGAVSGVSGGGSAGDITAVLAGAGLSGGGTEGDVQVSLAVPVTLSRGGTGATDAATARTNLGAAPLASPVFTGDPQAPTPATADNDTSIATTSYVKSQGYLTPPVNLTSQVTGVLPVANGGTAAATAPAALTSLGAAALAGATFTGAVVFTSGAAVQPSGGWAQFILDSPAGNRNRIYSQRGATARWDLTLGDSVAETGGNAGSDFYVSRYNDAGTFINQPLMISRSTGNVTMPGEISFGTAGKITNAGSYTYIYSGSTAGVIIGSGGDNYGRNSVHSFQDISGTSTWARFNSAGTANVSGAWTTISDAALKESVVPYTRGLADLVMLRPVGFSYVAGTPFADPDGTPHIGLIAQEVEPYVPEIVGHDEVWVAEEKVTVQTLDPSNLIYAVLNALRELDERLRALETQP